MILEIKENLSATASQITFHKTKEAILYGTWLLVQFLIWGTHFVRVLLQRLWMLLPVGFLELYQATCIQSFYQSFFSQYLCYWLRFISLPSRFKNSDGYSWYVLVTLSLNIWLKLQIYIYFKNSHSVNNSPPFIFGHHSHLMFAGPAEMVDDVTGGLKLL